MWIERRNGFMCDIGYSSSLLAVLGNRFCLGVGSSLQLGGKKER